MLPPFSPFQPYVAIALSAFRVTIGKALLIMVILER